MNKFDIMVFLFSIPALWLMGKKKKICFVIFTVVNILMITICMTAEPKLWGVFAMQLIYIAFNVRNYILWRKSENKEEVEKYTS